MGSLLPGRRSHCVTLIRLVRRFYRGRRHWSCAAGTLAALIPLEAQTTSRQRRPMSDRRRHSLDGPARPEQMLWRASRSLPLRQHPARAIAPSRGFSFHSEVQCLDVVSTESRSPAHRAACLAARGTPTITASSVLSSMLPCVIVADAASTAPFRWRSTSRRSITCTPCRREDPTPRATWSRRVRHAIASRATCCPTSSSAGIHGRARTSSGTLAPSIARSSGTLAAP